MSCGEDVSGLIIVASTGRFVIYMGENMSFLVLMRFSLWDALHGM